MSEPFKAARRHASRRDFMLIGGAAALGAAGGVLPTSAQARTTNLPGAPSINTEKSRPNILFIFTDQERYQRNLPPGLSLPAHERLQRTGVTFHNHYCPAVMCTSSRAVLLTGLQTPDNGLFENLDVPWVSDLSPKIPTMGHMLRKAGYYTAYKGKWHLSRKFDVADQLGRLGKEMEKYGTPISTPLAT